MALPFTFLIDTPQQRIKTVDTQTFESVSTLCGAEDWDIAASTNAYLDGVSGTVMTTPGPKTSGWIGSNSGITAKLARTDFTLDDSSNWIDNLLVTGDGPFYNYQLANTGVGLGGLSNSTFPANQAMFLEWFSDNTNPNPNGVIQCGYNSSVSGASGVELRFYDDGKFDVGKDGNLLASYSISGKSAKYGQTDQVLTGQSGPDYVGVMIIPFREREILVLSTQGGGAVHVFQDIPEGTPNPVITAATNFWFFVPGGATSGPPDGTTPNVRVSVLQFASSATLVGKRTFWRYDPTGAPPGGFQTWLSADLSFGTPTATVAVNDGVNPANPYANNTNGVRLVLSLGGSTYGGYASSPYIFGSRGYTETQTADTAGDSVDISAFFQTGLEIDVSDSISGTSGHASLVYPDGVEDAGVPAIDTQTNRPIQFVDETGQILDGTFNAPKKIYSTVFGDGENPETKVIEVVQGEIKDRWKTADSFMFTEPIPLGGMALDDAYALLCSVAGLDSNISASFHSFLLPDAGNPTISSEFNVLVKPGDKLSEWLDRLHKTYAGTAFHGISGLDYGAGTPAGTFNLIDPADMPTDPYVVLYDGYASALAGGVLDPGPINWFRNFDMQQIEAEANDVYVVGYDFRNKRPILYRVADFASMTPTTLPVFRPDNWLGEPRKYSWIDASLTSMDACTYVGNLLAQRLTQQRQLIEFECEYQPGLVRGQMVQLVGTRVGTVTARIRSMHISVDHVSAELGFDVWRPVRYVAQIGNDVSALHAYGTKLHSIADEFKLRARSKNQFITDEDFARVWARPFLQAQAA